MVINPHWKLYARIFNITVCRECGQPLDKDFNKRRRGKLCNDCNVKDTLRANRGIDFDVLNYK